MTTGMGFSRNPMNEHEIAEWVVSDKRQNLGFAEAALAEASELMDRRKKELAKAQTELAAAERLQAALALPRGGELASPITPVAQAVLDEAEEAGKAFRVAVAAEGTQIGGPGWSDLTGFVKNIEFEFTASPSIDISEALSVPSPPRLLLVPSGLLVLAPGTVLKSKEARKLQRYWASLTVEDWNLIGPAVMCGEPFSLLGYTVRFMPSPR